MPFAHRPGARIWWDQDGTGDPILLIMGHAYGADMWHRTAPELAASYRVIRFDNRGVGRSSDPPGPYSVPLMAEDALAVLDAAGVASAHVYGVSLGGAIALQLALDHPGRVRSLILGCTAASAGGCRGARCSPGPGRCCPPQFSTGWRGSCCTGRTRRLTAGPKTSRSSGAPGAPGGDAVASSPAPRALTSPAV